MLHYAIFRATCPAILLRHKLHEKLHGVTYPQSSSLATFLLQQALHEVESSSTFATSAATLQRIFEALHSVTPLLQLVSQCFVQSANKNTPSTVTSSSEGQFARNIAGCYTLLMQQNETDLAVVTQVARQIA